MPAPDQTSTPAPINPGWWDKIPSPVQKLLVTFLTSLVMAAIAFLAARYGFKPPEVVIESAGADKSVEADDAPPPDMLNFCGHRLKLIEKLQARPWPNRVIKWTIDTSEYRGRVLTPDQIIEAFDVAWKAWARDLDIQPTYVPTASEADVQSRFGTVYDDNGQVDGPGSILAWSELSDGSGRPRRQMYDRHEPWTISSNPGQATIDLVRVAAHEIGHAMGLDHAPMGSPELLAPMYNRAIQLPTAGDIDRMVMLGYPRRQVGKGGGSNPPPAIKIEFSADPERLAELLRKHGYKVELNMR